ncbi:hypothetical protein KUTeg_007948 [Tegillarca granosa]|uniref:TIR domain-containing protein n=1 Tax=Tegillarca granosa TaxID=220873 RepID=A0ABQ9FEM7_TEGGR|nr:hypothetical protein KUTeg_007948 [Tegillarca granosa]
MEKYLSVIPLMVTYVVLVYSISVPSNIKSSLSVNQKISCSESLVSGKLVVDCSNRNLSYIPTWLSGNISELVVSNNPLRKLPDNSFMKFRKLQRLVLCNCEIQHLDEHSFHGLTHLLLLDLSSNKLMATTISLHAFRPLERLTDLLIHNNLFFMNNKYPDIAISYLYNLNHLSIDAMKLVQFGHGFQNLSSLKALTIKTDRADSVTLKNTSISPICKASSELKYFQIDINYGFLIAIDIGIYEHCKALTGLRVFADHYSDIKMILGSLYGLQGRSMEYLKFPSCNKRIGIDPISLTSFDFRYLRNICTKQLDIQSNNVRLDSSFTSALLSLKHKDCLEKINIAENVFTFEFSPYFVLFANFVNLRHLDLFSMKKLGVEQTFQATSGISNRSRNMENKSLFGFNTSRHINIYLSHNIEFINSSYMQTSGVDIPIITFHGGKLATLDFSYSHFDSCDGEVLGLTLLTHLGMSGWNCQEIGPKLLNNMTSLKILEAEDNNLEEGFSNNFGQTFLRGLKNLSILKLSRNMLTKLHEEFFVDQHEFLQEIYLGGNKFKNIPFDVPVFSKLQFIDLSNNVINTLSKSEQEDLDNVEKKTDFITLDLSGNQLQCTCNNLNFLRWMNKTNVKFRNIANTNCVDDEQTAKNITDILNNIDAFARKCTTEFWLMFSAISVTILITGLILSVLVYRYRFVLEYFILRIKRRLKKYKPLEDNFEYDVFVSYSSLDYEWVTRCLYVNLSGEFKVCLYDRDFIPGVPISENIINAIDSSRKVMFVITENFLNSSWGNYEMEMTRMHAFQNGRDSIVIVLLKDDIAVSDMPKVLRSLWWKVVCLQWSDSLLPGGEDLFWARTRDSILH